MHLTGADVRNLRTAVLRAVENEAELARLLEEGMDVRLREVVGGGNLSAMVFELITWLEARGRTEQFLLTLRHERPTNAALIGVLDALERAHSDAERRQRGRRELRSWVLRRRWHVAAVMAIVIGVGSVVLILFDNKPRPVQKLDLWEKAFVVHGQSIAYASPDSTYEILKERLKNAQKSILIAVYEFTAPHIKDLVLEAVHRGIKVTLLLGTQYAPKPAKPDFIDELASAGVEVIKAPPGRGGPFGVYHPKIIVIDAKWTVVQTGNLASSSVPPPGTLIGNRDMGIVLESPELARYFIELLQRDERLLSESDVLDPGEASEVDPKYLAINPVPRFEPFRATSGAERTNNAQTGSSRNSVRVFPILTPDNYLKHVPEILASAEASFDIVMPYIRPRDQATNLQTILDAIKEARLQHPRLRLRLIIGKLGALETIERLREYCDWISESEIRVLNSDTGLNCTNKLIIVDGCVSLVGSAHWSEPGVATNREIGVVIDSKGIADYYGRIFQVDWDHGSPISNDQ